MMNPSLEFRIQLFLVLIFTVVAGAALKAGGKRALLQFVAAWLVPGVGHVVAGKWRKGLFFFALLGLTYTVGMWITGFRAVTFDDNPFYYFGKYGSGLTLLLARVISVEKAVPRLDLHPSWFDPGLLYVCVMGLLNLVLMLNVLDLKASPKSAPSSAFPVVNATEGKPSSAPPMDGGPEGKPAADASPPPAPAAPEAAA